MAAAACGILAFVVYLVTLAPTLPPGDSGDLITAAVTLGIAHPPGYPLFVILGHVFSLLPIGDPAFRINLMSATCDAVAVALFVILVDRILRDLPMSTLTPRFRTILSLSAGVIGALALAFATQFWSYSLVAEVFALNNLFAVALLLLAFLWYQDQKRSWALYGFFLGSGLAFSNQQVIALLAPALGTFLLAGIVRTRARGGTWVPRLFRQFAIGVGLLIAGLLPYLYLPIAAAGHPPLLWGDPSTLSGFIAMVSRSAYGTFSLVAGGQHGTVSANLSAYFSDLWNSFGPVGLAMAVLGVVLLIRFRPVVALAMILAWLVTGPLFLAYANPPLGGLLAGVFSRFYILPSISFAVLVGCGVFQLGELVLRGTQQFSRSTTVVRASVVGVSALLLLAVPVASAAGSYSTVNQSGNQMTTNFIHDMLDPLAPNAILLAEGDTSVLGTWYIQHVEQYRPDVDVISVPLLYGQWYVDAQRREHPDVVIPFEADQVVGQPVTDQVLTANIQSRPVYYVGVIQEAFPAGYGQLRTGFARQFVPTADAGDEFGYVRSNLDTLTKYHWPTQSYPSSTWENWESDYYSGAAFDLANAYETLDVGKAEDWYREAITLNPERAASYKNLAILLMANNGTPAEEIDLLTKYLQLDPSDPQAASINATITNLRTGNQ